MAVQFTVDSHFNEDARYRKVLFGYDGQLLEVELNELQDIMNARLNEVVDNVFGSRPLYTGTYTVSGGVLTIANEVVIANRELILLTNTSIAIANGDTIYLNVQTATKTNTDPIKQYGDQNTNTTVTNQIQDSRVGAETTRRVQVTFQLVKVNTNPGTNIQLCTINSSGAVVQGNPDSFADSNLYKEIRRLANEQQTSNNLQPLKNVFGTVTAGGTSIPATTTADTVAFAAGTAVSLAGNASTKTVTISVPNVTTTADGSMSAADKTKLNGIATGAEVNQNAFSNASVNGTTLASTSKTDTLTFSPGNGITLTGSGKTVTIAGTAASTSVAGVVQLVDSYTSTDTTKAATANSANLAYTNAVNWAKAQGLGTTAADFSGKDLNTLATTGFYKVTTTATPNTPEANIAFYIISIQYSSTYSIQVAYKVVDNTVVYQRANINGTWSAWTQMATTAIATEQVAGLLSAADKQKLDGMQAGATISADAYGTVVAGGTSMAATSTSDTFTITAGTGITVTGANKTATIAAQAGSTSQAGILQLVDSYTSTDTTKAATANSANLAYNAAVNWVKGYGLGTMSVATAADLNTVTTNGFYYSTGTNNRPVSANGWLIVQATDANNVSQTYVSSADGSYWWRSMNAGVWGMWMQMAMGNQSVGSGDSPTFVNTTLTGALNINENGNSTLSTTINGVATAGNFLSGSAVGDLALRNELNGNILIGFKGASGTENPALKLGYNGVANSATVATQRNTLDNGSGGASFASNVSVGGSLTSVKNTLDNGSGAATFIGTVTAPSFTSNVASGTAPFTVTSPTKVTNLNADQVDGYHLNQGVQTTDSPSFSKVTSTVATGTAPLTVTSTTTVTNLSADMVDGYHLDQDVRTTASPTHSKLTLNVASGTAPMTITSTTVVPNLNVDMVDGYHMDQDVRTTASPTHSKLTLNVASGTAPLTVTSTTVVPNLNVDMVDGYHLDQDVRTTASPTFAGMTATGKIHINGTADLNSNMYVTPTGTATSTSNYASNYFQLQNSIWNGTAAVTQGRNIRLDSSSAPNIIFADMSNASVAYVQNDGTFVGKSFDSTVATGTAPLTVASTTVVTNLNADMTDGYHASTSATASTLVARDASANISANAITSTVATGTAPLTVASTTKVANLNADMVDGYSFNQSLQTTDSPSFSKVTSTVATGTAPFTVTSTTKVTNLNADMVDGYSFNQGVQTTDSPTFAGLTASGTVNHNGATYARGNIYVTATGTATSSANYGSNFIELQNSTWNGTAAVTNSRNILMDASDNIVFQTTGGSNAAYVDNNLNMHANTFVSIVATGTAPFTVSSTTKVTNLNADMVDGYSFNQSLQTTDNVTFAQATASTLVSTVASGTAPFTVTSTTAVANLNADMVDGYHMNQDVRSTASPTFAGVTSTSTINLGIQGTATSATNYGSHVVSFQNSTWNGTAAVTNNSYLYADDAGALSYTNYSDSVVAKIDQTGNFTGHTFTSNVATGTAPFTVSSTTKVTNLNADMVDGYSFNQSLQTTDSPTFAKVTASTLVSTVATGTAPFTVTSTTKVTNLNADMVDGYSFNQSLQTTDSPTFAKVTASTLVSTVAAGTAPFTVTSNTKVTNLNVDQVDGYDFNQALQTSSSVTFASVSASTLTSTVAAGTAPMTVTSNTMVTNLNANYVGGIALSGLVQTSRQVLAGSGLTGGGQLTADQTLSVSFGGTGTATTVSRSDHNHDSTYAALSGATFTGAVTTPSITLNVASGTAPMTVTSTTKVANLNVDMVDGYNFNQGVQTTDSPSFSRVTSTVATGTAPFTVTSTTAVTNLNADMVDGHHLNQDVQTTSSPTFAALTTTGAITSGTSVTITPSGVATSTTNYGSDAFQLQSSTWNGTAAVTNTRKMTVDSANTIQFTNTSGTNVASIDNSGNIAGNTLKSTVASGTAPLTVTSTTAVTNLNADMVDGYHLDQDVRTSASPTHPKITLNVAAGTAPLTVTSTTVVPNLNVDMVDGYHLDQDVRTTASPTHPRITLNVATGTAPLTVTSTTAVANLNADMVDGYHMNQGVQTTDSPTFSALTVSNNISAKTLTFAGSTATSFDTYGNVTAVGSTASTWNVIDKNSVNVLYVNVSGTKTINTANYQLDDGSGNLTKSTGPFKFIATGTSNYAVIQSASDKVYLQTPTTMGVYCVAPNTTSTMAPLYCSAVNPASREEWKTNIVEAGSGLEVLSRATIYEYNLKAELEEGVTKTRHGMIIGEGRNTPSEVIDQSGDAIDLYSLTAINTKAIQELKQENDSLRAQLAAIMAKLGL